MGGLSEDPVMRVMRARNSEGRLGSIRTVGKEEIRRTWVEKPKG